MTPLYEGDRSAGFGRFFVFGDENTPSNKFFSSKKTSWRDVFEIF